MFGELDSVFAALSLSLSLYIYIYIYICNFFEFVTVRIATGCPTVRQLVLQGTHKDTE